MSKLVTSGTGHVPVPVAARAPRGARTPPHRGDEKISKARFGFKGIAKIFFDSMGLCSWVSNLRAEIRETAGPRWSAMRRVGFELLSIIAHARKRRPEFSRLRAHTHERTSEGRRDLDDRNILRHEGLQLLIFLGAPGGAFSAHIALISAASTLRRANPRHLTSSDRSAPSGERHDRTCRIRSEPRRPGVSRASCIRS
jgi:hypothetical protein